MTGMRRWAVLAGFVVVAVVAGALALRLAHQERTGPPHIDIVIGDGIPATFHVPGEIDRDVQFLPDVRPAGQRPPVVVLAHGFITDRAIMSPLARSLVAHGYAVVTFDWRGHGENRNAFRTGGWELRDDLRAVIDWLETSPHVDPERIVVAGHSMGAFGALDFANVDERPVAVVALSGAAFADGPLRPRNVAFIVAEDDPQSIHDRVDHVYEQLTGEAPVDRPSVVGSHDDGSAVGLFEIEGRDHGTVLFTGRTVDAMIEWMDASLGVERARTLGLVDGRLGTALLYFLALLVLLAGVGLAAGRFSHEFEEVPRRGVWGGLLVLVVALLVASPFVSGPPPGGFVALHAGDSLQSFFAIAGAVVLVARAATARGLVPALPEGWLGRGLEVGKMLRPAVLPALVAVAAVYVLMLPLSGVFHRLVPTPERLLMLPVMAALTLPFTLVFHTLLRRGSTLASTLTAVLGRVVVLVALFVLSSAEVLPGVVVVVVPFLAVIFVLAEIVSTSIYAKSRNVAVIAVFEALMLGWLAAATMPIGFGPVA